MDKDYEKRMEMRMRMAAANISITKATNATKQQKQQKSCKNSRSNKKNKRKQQPTTAKITTASTTKY